LIGFCRRNIDEQDKDPTAVESPVIFLETSSWFAFWTHAFGGVIAQLILDL
jgi:hypothetical protein